MKAVKVETDGSIKLPEEMLRLFPTSTELAVYNGQFCKNSIGSNLSWSRKIWRAGTYSKNMKRLASCRDVIETIYVTWLSRRWRGSMPWYHGIFVIW
jgi:hypothetical protein